MKNNKQSSVIITIIFMISVFSVNFFIPNEFEGRDKTYEIKNENKNLRINPRTSDVINLFEDHFESSLSNWESITGLWHLTDTGSSWSNPCHSPTHSMWYGQELTGDYNTGTQTFGNLTSIPIDLSSVDNAYLEFYHWKQVEQSSFFDFSYVYLTTDNIIWYKLYLDSYNVAPWEKLTLNISSFCGNSSVRIRFYFDSVDGSFNYYRGWLVDDVRIYTELLQDYTMIPGSNYDWIDATGGTELLLSDDGYSTQGLPFSFSFYNNTYNTIYLGANGYLSFTDSSPSDYSNDPIPSNDTDNNYLIAPFWDDLRPASGGGGGQIFVQNFPDCWVAEWLDIWHFSTGPVVGTFEVILTKSGDIIFNYENISYHDGYTCGLNLGLGTNLYNSYQDFILPVNDFSILFTRKPNNYAPQLTSGDITPTSGEQSTLFTYTVNYTDFDNNPPIYMNVLINGISYSMSKQNPSETDYMDGCIYEFSTYLQPGSYNYYFECWDGLFYNSTSLTYNPVVSYTNLADPSLSNGQVNPATGWKGTTIFVFSVEYTDPDNNEPQFINVTINSTTYPMYKQNPLDSNFIDGCWYDANTVFDENGTYSYHFNCTDGESAAGDGPYVGPIVRPNNLRNYSMIVGHPYNWINTTTGTELLLGDNGYSTQDLPFNITYYNETYSTIYLGANGYLSFTDPNPNDASNDLIPSTDSDNDYLIAPFWDDLYTLFAGGNGTVYVQNFTNYWIAAWFDIEHMDGNYIGTFEVILYENGDIVFNYDLINYTDGGYTCGLNGLVLDAQTRYFNSYQEMNASEAPIDDFSILLTPNPPKNPYIIINNGANATQSTLVTLKLSAFGAEEMCFRNGTSGSWTSWEPYATLKQLYLENSTINTTSRIYVKFRNSRGESTAVYDDIIYLIFHPYQLSIVINNGDVSTNSTLVALKLLAVGAEEMCFRNGTTGNWTAWETYSTTKQLYLAGSVNNTVYTIYAKFRNTTGESYPIYDSILFLEGLPVAPAIPGYPGEWLVITLVGVIGVILLFNRKKILRLKN
jgi:hypothetical protein